MLQELFICGIVPTQVTGRSWQHAAGVIHLRSVPSGRIHPGLRSTQRQPARLEAGHRAARQDSTVQQLSDRNRQSRLTTSRHTIHPLACPPSYFCCHLSGQSRRNKVQGSSVEALVAPGIMPASALLQQIKGAIGDHRSRRVDNINQQRRNMPCICFREERRNLKTKPRTKVCWP